MAAPDNRLTTAQRSALAAILGANFLSGAAHALWGWITGPAAPAPYALLQLHGWTMPPLLLLAGALIPLHLRPGWRSGRSRVSGALFAGALALLALTGSGLYYIGNESARAACRIVHVGAGLALPLLLGVHIAAAGARRPPRPDPGAPGPIGRSGPPTGNATGAASPPGLRLPSSSPGRN